MAKAKVITLSRYEVLKFVTYEKETGLFYWKPRTETNLPGDSLWQLPRWNARWAGKLCSSILLNGYRKVSIDGEEIYQHRLVWFLETGEWPEQCDHVNGDRSDNRFCNLRNVTQTENSRNMAIQKRNKSGYIGVRWHQESPTYGRWKATIIVNYKTILLYTGQDKSAAVTARLEAEYKYGFHTNHGSTDRAYYPKHQC